MGRGDQSSIDAEGEVGLGTNGAVSISAIEEENERHGAGMIAYLVERVQDDKLV